MIEGGVGEIDIFLVHPFLGPVNGLAKALEVDDLPLPQKTDDVVDVGVIRHTQNVVIGHTGLLLSALGIPASNAITMFYKQVILQRGLPFEVKLPEHPLDVSRMTAEQLDTELEKGYAQMKTGQTIPAKQAFDELRGELGV